MGRKRIHDTHLPKRVYLRRGVYYFVDYLGKWHRLGTTMSLMYSTSPSSWRRSLFAR